MSQEAISSRLRHRHIDGTGIFTAPKDAEAEKQVSELISAAWGCELHHFGALCPIDWYATRDGRLVGLVELKNRSHDSGKYPTVYLNVRKWIALILAAAGLGVPAMFVVRFTDGIRWVKVADVDASNVKIGGWREEKMQAISDREPVIEVPVASLRIIK